MHPDTASFLVCLVVVAFTFAPLSAIRGGGGWDAMSGLSYVATNSALHINQAGVRDTLADNPLALDWNGSLWTLFYEFVAYLCAGVFLSVPIIRRHLALSIGCALALATILQRVARGTLGITADFFLNFLWFGCFFLAGMFLWAISDRLLASPWMAGISAVTLVPIAMLGYFTEPSRELCRLFVGGVVG